MSSEFIPLSAPCLKGNELKYLTECIQTEWVSSAGPFVKRFEEEISAYLNIPHAIACVNGTAALHISLILCNVKENEEVIVPTLTFIAPINAVRYVGAHPIFMDCDDYLNLDSEKLANFLETECEATQEGLKNLRSGRFIRALILVHVFGHPVNISPILNLAKKYKLKVIEDATESLGSYYKDSEKKKQYTGTLGDIGALSFNGNKIITTGGGGMIITQDKNLAERARHLTTQAKTDPLYFKHDEIGYNYRLTNLQAAVGVAQLEQLNQFIEIKRKNFKKYQEELHGVEEFVLIEEPPHTYSNYWHYTLQVSPRSPVSRDLLLRILRENQIESRPVWALCHQQKPFEKYFSYQIEKAKNLESSILNLPSSVSLQDDQIRKVTESIKNSLNFSKNRSRYE